MKHRYPEEEVEKKIQREDANADEYSKLSMDEACVSRSEVERKPRTQVQFADDSYSTYHCVGLPRRLRSEYVHEYYELDSGIVRDSIPVQQMKTIHDKIGIRIQNGISLTPCPVRSLPSVRHLSSTSHGKET